MNEKPQQYNKILLLLLVYFLGMFGVHQFLAGQQRRGVLYLALSLGAILMAYLRPFLAFFLILALTVLLIIDFVKIIQGKFYHIKGYSLVEGY
ncbi:NINE protein [Entomospira culicis]|uniref:NINE protein n=1 Tax=Entomospira culicis TaxID=2719989 RepID=A0A968GG22_9SPIO|nr:NINE protein [Entomospira culicis]NIZ18936.1 NINE protein [Entomospira culicis]NIZ69151.1 NINE protein [Entomospira culicis]WDI37737.1 NINE protein [Entomospira culicis]WDI39365.1 NINE protein [Entomospira culicis]